MTSLDKGDAAACELQKKEKKVDAPSAKSYINRTSPE